MVPTKGKIVVRSTHQSRSLGPWLYLGGPDCPRLRRVPLRGLRCKPQGPRIDEVTGETPFETVETPSGEDRVREPPSFSNRPCYPPVCGKVGGFTTPLWSRVGSSVTDGPTRRPRNRWWVVPRGTEPEDPLTCPRSRGGGSPFHESPVVGTVSY